MTTTVDADSITRALRDRVPDLRIDAATATHALDGIQPAVVVAPASQDEIATVLGIAAELGAAVSPRGGGTQTALGNPPERYDITLDLRRLDSVIEYQPADLTVTVEAGARLSEVQRQLGAQGQWLPLDPAVGDEATIGGILATNASGPDRIRYGSARDLVIGMSVALPNGRLVKSGGRVVKNVAGYDMAKLHIGALGTLGVITQASFKVAPLPGEEAYLAVDGAMAQLVALATDVIEARLPLLGLALTKDAEKDAWTLLIRAGGGEAAVERSEHDVNELAKAAGLSAGTLPAADWRMLLRAQATAGGTDFTAVRATVLPTRLAAVAAEIAESGAAVTALPGIGVLRAVWTGAVDAGVLKRLRGGCEASGGALVLEVASPELKRAVDVWGATRGDFALMQRLKQQFDPGRTLNPGRYVGGI